SRHDAQLACVYIGRGSRIGALTKPIRGVRRHLATRHGGQNMDAPAHGLLNIDLENGWRVVERLPDPGSAGGTGGHFSVGYIVEHADGRRAFLKALNLAPALQSRQVM